MAAKLLCIFHKSFRDRNDSQILLEQYVDVANRHQILFTSTWEFVLLYSSFLGARLAADASQVKKTHTFHFTKQELSSHKIKQPASTKLTTFEAATAPLNHYSRRHPLYQYTTPTMIVKKPSGRKDEIPVFLRKVSLQMRPDSPR